MTTPTTIQRLRVQNCQREILDFQRGEGSLYDNVRETYPEERLDTPDLLAVSTLGGLLPVLADEVREAAGRSQLLATTHAPYFVDALRPKELWVLYRDNEGFSRTIRASDRRHVVARSDVGGQLGNL